MSEASKKARSAMRDKARRMTAAGDGKKVDASDWTPPAAMKADKKTGMRPVSPRTYKLGGRVQGDRGPKRPDKAPRGNVANEISTRDTKQANRDKFGSPHIGGMKKGGAAHDDTKQDKALIKKMVKPSVLKRDAKCGGGRMANGGGISGDAPTQGYEKDKSATDANRGKTGKKVGGSVAGGERPEGGRIPRQSGGRTKGKTNINIIVNPTKPDQNAVPPSGPVRPPPPPMLTPPPPPMAPPPGAPPPNMPPPSMMAGPPPMRARGGRLGMNKIGGAGGGLGRLEKANLR